MLYKLLSPTSSSPILSLEDGSYMSEPNHPDWKKSTLPYGISTLDPKITITDITTTKNNIKTNVDKKVSAKLQELKDEFNKVSKLFNVNKKVLEAEFRFKPLIGETYHLYQNKEGVDFLSMIAPNEWNQKFLFSVRFNSDLIWELVDD